MINKRTDKPLLMKGLKMMLLAAFLMFTGPVLIYIAFANKESNIYLPALILGCILCVGAIVLAFKGLQTIMKSMFG